MAAYLLEHNHLENVTNSVYLILCVEMAMQFNQKCNYANQTWNQSMHRLT